MLWLVARIVAESCRDRCPHIEEGLSSSRAPSPKRLIVGRTLRVRWTRPIVEMRRCAE